MIAGFIPRIAGKTENPLHASGVEERLQFLEQGLRLLLRYEVPGLGDNDVSGNVLRKRLDNAPLCRSKGRFSGNREHRNRQFPTGYEVANGVTRTVYRPVIACACLEKLGPFHRFY